MKKLLPLAILTAVLLSGCGSSDPSTEEKVNETSEKITMDNGPLDPKKLKLEEFVVSATLAPCANEEFPVQTDVLAWDFDKDGAQDAVAIANCPTGDKRTTLVVGKATSRGWWQMLAIGGTEDKIELTGECVEDTGNLVCPTNRLDLATQKMVPGKISVYLDKKNALVYSFNAA